MTVDPSTPVPAEVQYLDPAIAPEGFYAPSPITCTATTAIATAAEAAQRAAAVQGAGPTRWVVSGHDGHYHLAECWPVEVPAVAVGPTTALHEGEAPPAVAE